MSLTVKAPGRHRSSPAYPLAASVGNRFRMLCGMVPAAPLAFLPRYLGFHYQLHCKKP